VAALSLKYDCSYYKTAGPPGMNLSLTWVSHDCLIYHVWCRRQ